MPKYLPSTELLHKLLRYEPDTGKLFWKARPVAMFEGLNRPSSVLCKMFNARRANKEAFTAMTAGGYHAGTVDGYKTYTHRVAWAMSSGAWPLCQIDHINRVRADNRIANLREATAPQNSFNKSMSEYNTSGTTGVCRVQESSMWRAYIMIDSVQINLGRYYDIEAAIRARQEAEKKRNADLWGLNC